MRPRGASVIGVVLALIGGLQVTSFAAPTPPTVAERGTDSDTAPSRARALDRYGRLPLQFVENRGQLDPRVAYTVQGRDASVFLTSRGLTFSLADTSDRDTGKRHVLKLDFVGADPEARPVGRGVTSSAVSFFRGSPDEWVTGLRTYSSVVYRDLWPGIDLVYTGTDDSLKYTFELDPGADADQIRLAYRGGTGARLGRNGELAISTSVGRFRDARPYAYQRDGRGRAEVTSRYRLRERRDHAGGAAYEYGFRLGDYDRSRPLVLDPAFLVHAGFLGGDGDERGLGVSVDGSGNAYVVGQTSSDAASFPVRVGPQLLHRGNLDAYVVKIDAAGTGLTYAGYIGGSGNDAAFDVSVDGSGNAYVTGFTTSTQATFPATVGPDLTFNGGEDSFVAKVNATGTSLVYAGYLGGGDTDFGEGIVVDGAGNAYVSGTTGSSQRTFPETGGPDLTYNGGRFDTYVAKVNPAGTALVYAGYVGGTGNDVPVSPGRNTTVSGGHVAVDAAGNAYLSGTTSSRQASFPDGNGFDGLPGPDQTFNGGTDAFVAKVRADGLGLVYAGYIGGSKAERGFGMAVDSGGNAYLTGDTESTQATFPVVTGPDLTFNGVLDTFVAKVRPEGTGLVYAGYLGGNDGDQGLGVAIHETGAGTSLYVVGHTHSSQASYPVKTGPDLTYNGAGENGDAFVAKLAPVPNSPTVTDNLVYSGYVGGAGEDAAFWVDVDADGSAYLTGDTTSHEFTFPDGDGFGSLPSVDGSLNGASDAFVAKVSEAPAPAHDDVADARPITGLPFTESLSTLAATSEPAEPSPCGGIGKTVWYSFTPSADISLAADTLGSDYDTVLAAYTGTSPSDLTSIGCNDDTGETLQSRLAFVADAGTTVYLQVGGFDGNTGNLTFTLAAGPPVPPNDDFADAAPIASLPFTDTLDTEVASFEADEQQACANVGKTVWYSFTPSADVSISANTFGSDFDTVLTAFTGTSLSDLTTIECNDQAADTDQSRIRFVAQAGTTVWFQVGGFRLDSGSLSFHVTEAPVPPNDDFADAALVAGLPFTQDLNTDAATSEPGEPAPCGDIANTVWYSFTPSADMVVSANTFGSGYDTVLAAYTGASLGTLTPLACNDQPALMKQSRITFAAQAGVTVHFQVGGRQGDTGNLTFHVAEAQPPPNDDFAAATPIGPIDSLPFSDSRSTTGATSEAGEPAPCEGGGKTVWYSFTPSADVSVTADTFGSDYDTVLAAYTGPSLAALSLVACNDQGGDGNQSRITLDARAGTTLHFQVAGSQGDSGNLTFTVAESPPPPVNDDFADAVVAPSLPFADSRRTAGTTTEPDEPAACGFVASSVWYSFTPGTDVTLTADTFGSDYDTILAVYAGDSLADLTAIACNDEYAGTSQSRVSVVASAGTQLYFQAGSLFGDTGDLAFTLAASTGTPPANDRFAAALPVGTRPFTASLSTLDAASEVGEPIACGGIAHTVWYSFTPGASGTITANTFGSGYDTVLAAYTGTSLTGLTAIACNDQAAGGNQSQIAFPVTAGTTVHLQVGGFFGATGDLVLTVP